MTYPRPQADKIQVNDRSYTFECYLKSRSFSYRCEHYYDKSGSLLLTVPITESNYNTE